jgi:hypothetical protein
MKTSIPSYAGVTRTSSLHSRRPFWRRQKLTTLSHRCISLPSTGNHTFAKTILSMFWRAQEVRRLQPHPRNRRFRCRSKSTRYDSATYKLQEWREMKNNYIQAIRFEEIEHTPAGPSLFKSGIARSSSIDPAQQQQNDCTTQFRAGNSWVSMDPLCRCWREACTASSSSLKIARLSSLLMFSKIVARTPRRSASGMSCLNLDLQSNVVSIPNCLSARTEGKRT